MAHQTSDPTLRPAALDASTRGDAFPLLGFDAIEFWVGNARQAADFWRRTLGLVVVAYAGPETGVRDRASYVLGMGELRVVVTSGLRPDDEIGRLVARHGDFVRDVGLGVPDAAAAHAAATARGAASVSAPLSERDEHGAVSRATIAAYGDTVHSLVDRSDYAGAWAPGYVAPADAQPIPAGPLGFVDHVVANVPVMDELASFYATVMGMTELRHFTDEDIKTEYSALMSKVVWDGVGRVKLPINEPAEGKKKSQIQEYLEFNGGPGVQHIAIAVDDICGAVDALRDRGLAFLQTPASYYEDLAERVGDVGVPIQRLAERGILADRDEEGYLLQIFTQNLQDRPTVFLELIERHGSRGFGDGNFKALFEAIEREQALRGNL